MRLPAAGSKRSNTKRLVEGARPGPLPAFLQPSLAQLADKPSSGSKWVHEIKYDGYRIQARIEGGKVRLLTRKALDWTARFPTIAAALEILHVDKALLDGEVVSEDDHGIPHFNDLQDDLKSGRRDRLRYHVFDLLYLDGLDLTGAVMLDRKERLRTITARLPARSPLRYSEHSEEDGATMLKHACGLGLEGIVSKRKDLPYRAGRGQHWVKIKCVQAQELVIFGYVPSTAKSGSTLLAGCSLRTVEQIDPTRNSQASTYSPTASWTVLSRWRKGNLRGARQTRNTAVLQGCCRRSSATHPLNRRIVCQ